MTNLPGEVQLLELAAAQSLYERAGVRPLAAANALPLAPLDVQECCTQAAADLLERIVQRGGSELLFEWLALAARAKRRPPPRLLPRLLDLGASQAALRRAVERVMDARGAWLCQFNAAWSAPLPSDSDSDWETGTKVQRISLLDRLRESSPARARELIQATWNTDPADERERWLTALAVGLNAGDEPWLESCLDDRSAKVREAAAELLARLPDSAYVRRMTERAQAWLTLAAPSKRGLLGRTKPPQLEAALPAEFDSAWTRDGLREKPAAAIGPRQWWLEQVLSRVPPAVWSRRFELSPEALVAAAPEEHRALLLRSWAAAYARHPSAEWTMPLFGAQSLQPGFLAATPAEQRPELVRRLEPLGAAGQEWALLAEVRQAWPPLDETTSAALMEHCSPPALLAADAARWIAPGSLEQLEKRLTSVAGAGGKKLDQALFEIALRRELHQEFDT